MVRNLTFDHEKDWITHSKLDEKFREIEKINDFNKKVDDAISRRDNL